MSSPGTRTPGARLAGQLQWALAQRGRSDPIYKDLSDHWTQIMQRLYPVWLVVAPGVADPAHIHLRSRTVFLDSDELLGSRADLLAGTLDRRAILRTFGVALHETAHAKHTKRWVAEAELDDEQLAIDVELLEEPRMEAHGVRDFPAASARGRFVRSTLGIAVVDAILSRFVAQTVTAAATGTLSRDMCARAMTYLQARTHYGIVDRRDLSGLERVWREVLGDADVAALDDLYARLIWVPDGELPVLVDFARRYREIVGPPDPSPASDSRSERADASEPIPGSLAEALSDAVERVRERQQDRIDAGDDPGGVIAETVGRAAADRAVATGDGIGPPTGRMPDRGVDRPPMPDEAAAARRFATALMRARAVVHRTIDKRTPGGRFSPRQYMRARAERAARRRVTARPWQISRDVHAPIEEPHVALVVDTSGSMGIHEYALGPIAWILAEGLGKVGGRLAIGLFGNGSELLTNGAAPLAQVPGIRTGGGTAHGGDAVVMTADQLDMENRRRPRAVYVLSDGGWWDTEEGVAKIRRLADLGVPTIHISIGIEPLSIEADRVCVISDPADALDIVARDTVAALDEQTARSGR
ncbi:vWA domain-containing protein [Conexibacter sp. CPCC 206217]|uniref:vWA domain-containing protein n=1 Tax=Conexibacter sp. CPCC 206217 TaxID=3064574 RepID=UPI0027161037|nr:vWA domain-containing protein [Conexibacter sp. CPCC 206217]MDO8208969.1 VWA domain-containing protein [Conexibacter sp. CPCC 206217]